MVRLSVSGISVSCNRLQRQKDLKEKKQEKEELENKDINKLRENEK
jgi:hypothetical protein